MAQTQTRDFLIGVLVGSAIGAAAALLYAPQSGAETRGMIKDRATEAYEKTGELAQTAKAKTTEIAGQVRAKTEDLTNQARTKVDELRTQAVELGDRVKGVAATQREAVLAAVDAGKQAYTDRSSTLQSDGELAPAS